MSEPSLRVVQQWLQSVLQHPAGVMAGAQAMQDQIASADISRVITSSARQTPAERLAIYGRAYWARLLDCLSAEFPAVKVAAGDEAFTGFAAGYLQARPSTSHSLSDLGGGFSQYLSETRPTRSTVESLPDYADFLIDLAALERCYSEVFDLAGPERTTSLSSAAVAAISPAEFATSRLQLHATVRLMALRFPCQEYASAVRQSRELRIPAPRPSWLIVYRQNYVVRRWSVPRWQFELLAGLRAGDEFTTALARAVQADDVPLSLETELRACLTRWTAAPLFRGIETP